MTGAFRARVSNLVGFRPHLPRRTVRTRLTLIYSGLFLLSGAGLLAITYFLVRASTDNAFFQPGSHHLPVKGFGSSKFHRILHAVPPATSRLPALVAQAQANDLHRLLVESGIALAIMMIAAVGLGYFFAGRVLRPLRDITAKARGISASSLYERLAVAGPDDELKELGDTFDNLLGRLERSFAAQRQFVANVSHELRSPLTRMRLVAELAMSDSEATIESLRAVNQRVIAESERQEELIEALLALARSQAGLDRRESFDLAAVTKEAVFARDSEIEQQGLDVHTDINPAVIDGDPRLIERLVTNLIDNAVRHNVTGGQVEILTANDACRALLTVCNDGPQIPPTEVDRLFRPFQRLAAGRRHHTDGHGLGLSIVKAIADAHGASLAARPRTEGGLRIEVRFPASPATTTVATARPEWSLPTTGTATQHPVV